MIQIYYNINNKNIDNQRRLLLEANLFSIELWKTQESYSQCF